MTLAYSTPGGAPIEAGIALGNNGSLFFATLGIKNTESPKLFGLNASHGNLWTPKDLGANGLVRCVPSVSPSGDKVYLGTDANNLLAVYTATGNEAFNYMVPGSGDRKIRCTPALNFNASQVGANGAVYFHCNDGKLYGLDATTGTPLTGWPVSTGNNGGPRTYGVHQETWSSSPVIATDGRIYVGSANGHVYGFTPGGSLILDVNIGLPIEGSLAVGADGWLFGGTRESINYSINSINGNVFAIDPSLYSTGNPNAAIRWNINVGEGPLNYIASPVIDQSGFVYFTEFGHYIRKFHPTTGAEIADFHIPGKACQTPAINQSGMIFVGSSGYNFDTGQFVSGVFQAFDLAAPGEPYWTTTEGAGQTFGDFLGAVLIRATSNGRVYLADMAGRLYYFDSGAPLMAGDWPTYAGSNRRMGVPGQYPFVIAALPGSPGGTVSSVTGMNAWGDAVGQTYGNWAYPASGTGYYAARWQMTYLTGYGSSSASSAPYFGSQANAINNLGAAAGFANVGAPGSGPLGWNDTSDIATVLSVPPEFTLISCVGKDINNAGNIIGYGQRIGGGVEVLRWNRSGTTWGTAFPLSQPAGNAAYGNAITDLGFIAGKAKFTPGGTFHAAYASPYTGFTDDLGTFGGASSEATDINDEGGIVGWANNTAGKQRAFARTISNLPLQMADELPRLPGTASTTYSSKANSVNRFGQVAGFINNDSGAKRAFLYTSGSSSGMLDLNLLTLQNGITPTSLGWSLTEAVSLNDAGHILGYGTKNGTSLSWIIYPIVVE